MQHTPQCERNYDIALKKHQVLMTMEMMDWLQDDIKVPHEMGDAFLAAWTGMIRAVARHHANTYPPLSEMRGETNLLLGPRLTPQGWDADDMACEISRETAIVHSDIEALLDSTERKLTIVDRTKAFEPLGWILKEDDCWFLLGWRNFTTPAVELPWALDEDDVCLPPQAHSAPLMATA